MIYVALSFNCGPVSSIESELGRRILAWLAWRRLSQFQLAGILDVTPSAVTAWVKGKSPPTYSNLVRIARVIGVTLAEFFGDLPKK